MADVPIYVNDDSNLADAGKVFVSNFEVTGLGITEVPLALFRNPSGSGKLVKLIRLTLVNTTSTVNTLVQVRAYGAPTITSDGTGLSELCTRFGFAAGSAQVFSSPVLSGNGTRLAAWVASSFSGPTVIELNQYFILPETSVVALTAQADGVNRSLSGSIIWAEV